MNKRRRYKAKRRRGGKARALVISPITIDPWQIAMLESRGVEMSALYRIVAIPAGMMRPASRVPRATARPTSHA